MRNVEGNNEILNTTANASCGNNNNDNNKNNKDNINNINNKIDIKKFLKNKKTKNIIKNSSKQRTWVSKAVNECSFARVR